MTKKTTDLTNRVLLCIVRAYCFNLLLRSITLRWRHPSFHWCRRKSHAIFLTCIALTLLAGRVSAATSTFDSGPDGWQSVGFTNVNNYPLFPSPETNSSVNYSASGGNPGGYISKQDPDGNWQYFSAPSSFLGNQSGTIGSNLTFDELILNTFGQPPLNPQGPLVAITDGTTTLVFSGGGSSPPISGTQWNSLSVPFSATFWKVGTPAGAVATSAQFASVMSNLQGLYILSDFWTGSGSNGEIVGLDNVNLTAVSTGSTDGPMPLWALGALGAGMVGLASRRLKKIRVSRF